MMIAQEYQDTVNLGDTLITDVDLFSELDPMDMTLTFDIKKYQRGKYKEEYVPVELLLQINDTLSVDKSVLLALFECCFSMSFRTFSFSFCNFSSSFLAFSRSFFFPSPYFCRFFLAAFSFLVKTSTSATFSLNRLLSACACNFFFCLLTAWRCLFRSLT